MTAQQWADRKDCMMGDSMDDSSEEWLADPLDESLDDCSGIQWAHSMDNESEQHLVVQWDDSWGR